MFRHKKGLENKGQSTRREGAKRVSQLFIKLPWSSLSNAKHGMDRGKLLGAGQRITARQGSGAAE